MGEQGAEADMDLTWQEILSITELQGLDMQPDSSYDAEYGCHASMLPYPGCSFGNVTRDSMVPTASNNMENYNRPYMDAIYSQSQQPPILPFASGYGQTSYTGMLISSSITQMGAINHYPSKFIAMSGMSAPIDQVIMLDANLSTGHSQCQPCKGQDDFESDSGLSLNFSDGESMEIENLETHRLQSEYLKIMPSRGYQHTLAPNITKPITGHNIHETQTYIASLTQELVCSRDERRAAAMQIPFPADRIVNLPVEDFNELLSCYTLTESQMALVRDIRRRGKNKVAAQNCRKRKMENIAVLEREIGQLRTEREGLRRERAEVERIMGELKNSFKVLQQEVYTILRDQGNHLDTEDLLLNQILDDVSFSGN
ncbi:transcription factor NF-E2 45 kDa subunit [Pseudophryne corroboree]|uniref:transcription factor NF-E2 45 kDa subunit n=1 Tax=Pseudophryne corroboree TaxID=495146 RepID=UPI003081E1C7